MAWFVMGAILRAIIQGICLRFRTRVSLELEVIALRHQVNVLRGREWKPIKFSEEDRLLWAVLYHWWPQSINFMKILKPATVIHWHHWLFCKYWKWKRGYVRPHNQLSFELRQLIRKISRENPLWTAVRIQGELLHLGYRLDHKTIQKYMIPRPGGPRGRTPGWKAFLRNHVHETVGIDFAVVVSATFRLLYTLILIDHGSRKIIHFDVTAHPTSTWLTRQIRAAFTSSRRPKFLLRDRDAIYRKQFQHQLTRLGIQERIIQRRSPWQNAYVESVIALLRKECLNHIIPFNEKHLIKVLGSYIHYYNHYRPHTGLKFDSPCHRVRQPPEMGKIVSIPEVGGLHHRYERRAAK